jgi:hypothetical protein
LVVRLLRAGVLDLEATEMALREGMHQLGSRVLEKLLEVESQPLDSKTVDCGQGHGARWLSWRPKQLLTVLGPIKIRRSSLLLRGLPAGDSSARPAVGH